MYKAGFYLVALGVSVYLLVRLFIIALPYLIGIGAILLMVVLIYNIGKREP